MTWLLKFRIKDGRLGLCIQLIMSKVGRLVMKAFVSLFSGLFYHYHQNRDGRH